MMNLVIWPIDKNILFLWMAMHINYSLDTAFALREVFRKFISYCLYHAFYSENLSMQLLMRPFVLAIKIATWKWWTVITSDNSIRIYQGNNLKYKFLTHLFCIWVVACYEFEKPMHHKWWVGFAGMHSSEQYNVLFKFLLQIY